MQYINPLSVYVVWHHNCPLGTEISHKIFGKLCRDVEFPFDHRLGIPVYFRSAVTLRGTPKDITFTDSDRNVIICLIDDNMILDPAFKQYVIDIYSKCSSASHSYFIPVALSKSAFNIGAGIRTLNYIIATGTDYLGHTDTFHYIYYCVLHELCKTFISPDNPASVTPLVKLFVSHSKHDDTVKEAIAFRDYINSHTQLKTFFDANDIGYGSDFAKLIEENAGKCIVVAFLSDTYASREWCRNEIIIAKNNHCPIVIANAINIGERRSFPYLGNIPTKRWDGDSQSIVNLALEVTLSSFYIKASLEKQAELFKIQYDFILSNYPELFSIIGIKQKLKDDKKEAGIIIYPDPPLGNEELRLLNQMDERLSFITPLQLSSFLSYE